MGYPLLMGRFLPTGILGLVIASLLAAFMSTIDTHTNWGASYLVRDLYQRFIHRDGSERHYVFVSRLCILGMAALAGVTALFVHNIAEVWLFLLNLGAGLGSVTAARWYWSRVTPHAEFAALGVTTVLTVGLLLFSTPQIFGGPNPMLLYEIPRWTQTLLIAGFSLATWIPVSLFGPQNDPSTLRAFYARVQPPGPGWPRAPEIIPDRLWPISLRLVAGLLIIYGTLFGIGQVVLGSLGYGLIMLAVVAALLTWIIKSGAAPERA
jgi:Na+/proline symporter